jgi:hypothetical protein
MAGLININNMKAKMLKIAGVKSEKEFYKKYPTEEAFMKAHGKEFKKAQIGTYISKQANPQPFIPMDIGALQEYYSYLSEAGQKESEPSTVDAIGSALEGVGKENATGKKGKKIKKAQVGDILGLGQGPQLGGGPAIGGEFNWQNNIGGTPYQASDTRGTSGVGAVAKKKFDPTSLIPVAGGIIKGIGMLKEEREEKRRADQSRQLTGVQAKAAGTRPEAIKRQYVRPEDVIIQPEQMFPTYGVGTNVLAQDGAVINQIGGNPTEIQNMYNPGTIYTDLGYEPLNDTDKMKSYYAGGKLSKAGFGDFIDKAQGFGTTGGFGDVMSAVGPYGGNLGNLLGGGGFEPSGGGQIGSSIGGIFGPVGGFVGGVLGGILDKNPAKIKQFREEANKNIWNTVGATAGIGFQNQNRAYMEDGGIIKAQDGKDLTKKDGKCKAEEARNRADRAQSKVDASANAAWDREVARDNKEIARQNAQRMADYLSEGFTGYGDKIKKKDFEAAYQTFATQNPELAKDRLLYTLANKELNKVRNNPDYLMRNVLRRTDPNLDYKTLTLPQLMQTMQKGYGSGQGYYDAWKEGFPMRQSAIQQVVPIQQQNGGETSEYEWVSHTWQPQVITTFGEHKVSDLLKPPHDADMLRAGGHLKAYTPPSEAAMSTERPMMQDGGDINVYWGGYVEPTAQNPFLPGDGMQLEGFGQSHDESDGKGNTGIGIDFGGNPVEIERREPMVKLRDGSTGDQNLTVFGNINITKGLASLLDNPKIDNKDIAGMKFKNAMRLIGDKTNKQNKIIEDATNKINSLDVESSFDKLALGTEQMRILGANQKLMKYADQTEDLAALQNAINDTKEEEGLVDITDEGDVKAERGAKISKAQDGKKLSKLEALPNVPKGQKKSGSFWGSVTQEQFEEMKTRNPWYDWDSFNPGKKGDTKKFQTEFNRRAKEIGSSARLREDDAFGEQTASAKGLYDEATPKGRMQRIDLGRAYKGLPPITLPTPKQPNFEGLLKKPTIVPNKRNAFMDIFNQVLPYLRPSDAEELDPTQLMGEMYALANNQVEPVQAQKFTPELGIPYDISLQDMLNENQADYNATQRLVGYQPAALSQLNSQKYKANQRVLAEQFRLNQAQKDRVYGENRNILNQAKLQNLGILDQQYARQAQALSNTKATTQAALNSITSKYAQNKLDNRTLAVYENMYNYRYDPRFRAINMNPLQQFDTTVGGSTASSRTGGLAPGYEFTYDANGNIIGTRKTSKDETARNGSIVKNLKNI